MKPIFGCSSGMILVNEAYLSDRCSGNPSPRSEVAGTVQSDATLIVCSGKARRDMAEDTQKPIEGSLRPPRAGEAASKAEHAVRHAPEGAVAPHEKRTIGAETSREEDA
jgi:hypothetical protein